MPTPKPALSPVVSPLLEDEDSAAELAGAVEEEVLEADAEVAWVEDADVVVDPVGELVAETVEDATVYEATRAKGAGPEKGSTQSKAPELVSLQQAQS